MIHELKIIPEYYEMVKNREKPFEIRKNDRKFAVGDYLALNEYDMLNDGYTGRAVLARITCIISDDEYCKSGYVTLGIRLCALLDEGVPLWEVTRE